MNRSHESPRWLWSSLRQVLVLALVAAAILLTPESAVAAKKKKEVEQPTKSYVLPYIIVLAMIGVGLMTVCRPSSRADTVDDGKMNKTDEE